MNVIILLGAPGSGKGTLAAELAKTPGIVHLSSGDLLRGAVKAGTVAGREAKTYMTAGNLVPDALIAQMIDDYIEEHHTVKIVLLDGFPRTVPQAELLGEMLARKGVCLKSVLLLEVPDEVVIHRIAGRRVCPKCGAGYNVDSLPSKVAGICDVCATALITRADDAPETVKHRLDVYAEQTIPLIAYYRERGVLHVVDGTSDEMEPK
ncbi:MAG: adenylate kinase, partial [Kiritimatiellia bacterium]